MLKSRTRRLTAISGLVVSLAAILALTVASTGAYFTDTKGGQVSGTIGTVTVNVSGGAGAGGLDFDFTGILPGVTKTATINIGNPTGASEDIYLVFKNDNGMWSAVNDLGQYGTFTVGGYTYDNLNNKNTNPQPATPGVAGSAIAGQYMSGSCSTVNRVPINYLPHAIKIATLGSGATSSFNMSFQYIACLTSHQGESLFSTVGADVPINGITPAPLQFAVVAFQAGVDATSPFNGANAITPLVLTTLSPFDNQENQF